MGIKRIVDTVVECDVCGEELLHWRSNRTGVSRIWAEHYARMEGGTVGKKGVICKECRIKERQKKCAVIKKVNHPGRDEDGKCLGYGILENCKRCIAYTGYDWVEK